MAPVDWHKTAADMSAEEWQCEALLMESWAQRAEDRGDMFDAARWRRWAEALRAMPRTDAAEKERDALLPVARLGVETLFLGRLQVTATPEWIAEQAERSGAVTMETVSAPCDAGCDCALLGRWPQQCAVDTPATREARRIIEEAT